MYEVCAFKINKKWRNRSVSIVHLRSLVQPFFSGIRNFAHRTLREKFPVCVWAWRECWMSETHAQSVRVEVSAHLSVQGLASYVTTISHKQHKNEIICTCTLSACGESLRLPKQIGTGNKLAKKVSNNYADEHSCHSVCIQYRVNFYTWGEDMQTCLAFKICHSEWTLEWPINFDES